MFYLNLKKKLNKESESVTNFKSTFKITTLNEAG